MAKEEGLEVEGVVMEATKNGFLVQTNEGAKILAHLAGKMRMHNIRIVAGDRVTVELSPYDLTRGRITYRTK